MSRETLIKSNNFLNSNFNEEQYHEKVQQNTVNINLEKIGDHMQESAKTENNLKIQTEQLRKTNEELEIARKNYKNVTEKVHKVAIEHPVPGFENEILPSLMRLEKQQVENQKEIIQRQKNTRDIVILAIIASVGFSIYSQFKK